MCVSVQLAVGLLGFCQIVYEGVIVCERELNGSYSLTPAGILYAYVELQTVIDTLRVIEFMREHNFL